jgi:hypothetical protein
MLDTIQPRGSAPDCANRDVATCSLFKNSVTVDYFTSE